MRKCYGLTATVLALLVCSATSFADPAHVDLESQQKTWSMPTLLAEIPEVEPNGSLATAQALGCGNTLRPARLLAGVAPPDTDYVSFTATVGELITIGTDADGTGSAGDTRIRLFNDSGVALATDDDSGPGAYSLISGFVAPYTGTYYVGIAAFSSQTGAYRAFIVCCPVGGAPVDDVCAGASVLQCGPVDQAGSTACYTNNYNAFPAGLGGCTGFSSAGRDRVIRIDAAPGDFLDLTYTSTGDGSIYLITDCANPSTTCVAGADATLSGQPEVLQYTFTSAGSYYLILDTFGTNTSGDYTLVGSYDCGVVPVAKKSWGAVKQIYR